MKVLFVSLVTMSGMFLMTQWSSATKDVRLTPEDPFILFDATNVAMTFGELTGCRTYWLLFNVSMKREGNKWKK